MSPLFRRALIFLFCIFSVSFASGYLTYLTTREAYREVGFNDGYITRGAEIYEDIKKKIPVGRCEDFIDPDQPLTKLEIVSVKAEVIYVLMDDEKRMLQFCQPRNFLETPATKMDTSN